MSKQSFGDPRPLTLYLYLLSALFSFCWAMGTELWKHWAAACTNSLGSLARLFNPFHRRLTLMSPARLLQTCHHSRCTQDWHTSTHTNIHTSQHRIPLEGMLNDAVLVHPSSPLTLCPLPSLVFLPCLPPFRLFLSLHRSQRGHRWPWVWKTRETTPWGEVRHLQTHPLCDAVTHTWINTHTWSQETHAHAHAYLLMKTRYINVNMHETTHPTVPKKTQRTSKHTCT